MRLFFDAGLAEGEVALIFIAERDDFKTAVHLGTTQISNLAVNLRILLHNNYRCKCVLSLVTDVRFSGFVSAYKLAPNVNIATILSIQNSGFLKAKDLSQINFAIRTRLFALKTGTNMYRI